MAQAKTLTTAEMERLLTHINTRKYSARNRSMMLLTHWAGLRIGEVACLRWSDATTTDGEIKDEIRLLPDMTKAVMPALCLSAQNSEQNYKPTPHWPSVWIAATHFLQVRKASGLASTQIAWHKRLLCFTRALDWKALVVTADAGHF